MPQLLCLKLKRLDEPWVTVSQCIDRHAAAEIEVDVAVGRKQCTAVAAFEP